MLLFFYLFSLITASVLSLVVIYFSWKRRPNIGATPLALIMVCVFIWMFSQLIQDFSSNYDTKYFWYSFRFIGITTVPICWVVLSLQYSRLSIYINKNTILLSLIIPFLTVVFVFFNPNQLFLNSLTFKFTDFIYTVNEDRGLWYYVHMIYSFSLVILGILILFQNVFKQHKIYRKQAVLVLVGASLPFISNVLFVTGVIKLNYFDLTPITMLAAGLMFFYSLFKYKLFDLKPIAKDVIFEGIHDLIMVIDDQKRLVDANKAAIDILDSTLKSKIGVNINQVLSSWPIILENINNPDFSNGKINLILNGSARIYDMRISYLYDKKLNNAGGIVIFRDITILENAFSDLERSREAALQANNAKSEFLATMSHEIRTPISSIIGASELMDLDASVETQKEYINIIKNSADSLLALINNILDFSKIEAGKTELEFVNFNLRELLETIINTFTFKLKEKEISLKLNFNENVPDLIYCDQTKLKQILLNLLSNAIKFTHEGNIEVNVSFIEVSKVSSTLNIQVNDTGIGIPEDKLDRLFKTFTQVDTSTTRKYGGTGLGLSIVQKLVDLLNGRIEVESTENKGSCFSLSLPLCIPIQKTELNYKQKKVLPLTSRKLKILLAEDNDINAELITRMIKKNGWSVICATNGLEVLELYEKHTFDLVFMDIQMPHMDGYETTMRIREYEKKTNKRTPIIALTANALNEDREKCTAVGMDEFITKPIRSSTLYAAIEKLINS